MPAMHEVGGSDRPLLDLIRRSGPSSVEQLAHELAVTPTAVRNRLARLVALGLVERASDPSVGRGRPRHRYQASLAAQRALGQNYAELALALWDQVMHAVEDRKLRRVLFGRVVDKLASLYRAQLRHEQLEPRMIELGGVLHDQGVQAEVTHDKGRNLPILRQHSCPYHTLAEMDRAICALERKMLEKVLGHGLRLAQCRLDGHRSCDFEPKPTVN